MEGAGRPRITSRAEIQTVAFELFERKGFDLTTADDIAAAVGVSRRTFFRYFPSKNDVVWGEFDAMLADLAAWLHESPTDAQMFDVLIEAIVRFNAVPLEAMANHRRRMALILDVPALQAHSTLRYADWRRVIARFAGDRLGLPVEGLLPQLVGHVMLAASLTAYEQWLADPASDLSSVLSATLASVRIDVKPPARSRSARERTAKSRA